MTTNGHGAARGEGPQVTAAPFLRDATGRLEPLLSATERERLGTIATAVRFRAGETIYAEGAPVEAAFNLVRGVAKTYKALASGGRRITAFLFAGDVVGLAESGRYVATAEALTPVLAYRLPLAALDRLLRRDPDLQHHLLCKLCHELREAEQHAIALGRRDASGKLAMLLRLVQQNRSDADPPEPDGRIRLPMSRTDIADYVGVTPEAVSRAFGALRRAGILRPAADEPRCVEVLDPERFERLIET